MLFGLLLVGCPKGPPPDSVRIELPGVVLDRTPVRPVVKARRSRESTPVAQGAYTLKAEPPALATTSVDGTLTCVKSGDGKVTVDVQGVQGTAPLRCRMLDRVEVDELSTLDLTKGVVVLKARVVDKAGKELSDVPISVSSTNRDALTVQDFQVTPQAVGAATLVVRAGSAEKKAERARGAQHRVRSATPPRRASHRHHVALWKSRNRSDVQRTQRATHRLARRSPVQLPRDRRDPPLELHARRKRRRRRRQPRLHRIRRNENRQRPRHRPSNPLRDDFNLVMSVTTIGQRGNTLLKRMRLLPGESTPWHRDPYERVTTVLTGGVLAIEFRDGSPVEHVRLTRGQATFEEPVDKLHRAVNVGTEPYEEVSVFFLDRPDAVPQPGEAD